ncbi:hypothetical protein [Parendozoicomonas haliclonae]|uniref:Uncharacterized protein n=1 Tax=Parendozoicomonas haliclonae TaxID=1960125 RepID=A0A1X7AE03_9GAMM|nr:hypothetical protein [Parendozoicomonas haliclonae]SMA33159.1 hypothetical protein EHSB41UT_00233 [Parendozoicomonas haliclonae]
MASRYVTTDGIGQRQNSVPNRRELSSLDGSSDVGICNGRTVTRQCQSMPVSVPGESGVMAHERRLMERFTVARNKVVALGLGPQDSCFAPLVSQVNFASDSDPEIPLYAIMIADGRIDKAALDKAVEVARRRGLSSTTRAHLQLAAEMQGGYTAS